MSDCIRPSLVTYIESAPTTSESFRLFLFTKYTRRYHKLHLPFLRCFIHSFVQLSLRSRSLQYPISDTAGGVRTDPPSSKAHDSFRQRLYIPSRLTSFHLYFSSRFSQSRPGLRFNLKASTRNFEGLGSDNVVTNFTSDRLRRDTLQHGRHHRVLLSSSSGLHNVLRQTVFNLHHFHFSLRLQPHR